MLGACGNSSDLTNANPTLDGTPPPAPEGLAAAEASDRNELTWTASVAPDVASYQVFEYEPDPARENSYVMVAETSTPSYRLPRNTEVDTYFRVRAVDTAGNTSPLSAAFHAEFDALASGGGGSGNVNPDDDARERFTVN